MELKCINNDDTKCLTLLDIYTMQKVSRDEKSVRVMNDAGENKWYCMSRFSEVKR